MYTLNYIVLIELYDLKQNCLKCSDLIYLKTLYFEKDRSIF